MNKKVALFANGWNGENLDSFIEGFNEFFTDKDVDLFVFTSHMLPGFPLAMRNAEDSIYDLPDYSFFDAAIVFGSGMNSADQVLRFIEKCKAANVPVILQGIDMDGVSSVTVDNYVGMKSLCDHIIEQHGVSEVVYIAGDVYNGDSNLRMKALQESLEAHGHALKKENIFYANWNVRDINDYIAETYGSGKKSLPDAFVCANDQMALSTLSFLDQMGIKMPEEVIVTGFDNMGPGRVFSPSLSTVDQGYREQGMECAKFVTEAVNNTKLVKKSVLPTILSPGESCGCLGCKEENELRKKNGKEFWSNRYLLEVMQGRQMHLDMCIVTNERFEHIHKSMNEDFLTTVGQETEDFHVYVNPQYKELKYKNVPDGDFTGPYYEPVMDVIAARTGKTIYGEDTVESKHLFLGYDGTGEGKTYVFVPLRMDDSVFGYMVMGYSKDAIQKKKYMDFAGCLRTTFTQYQRNIEDYYRANRIKEQANIFLQQTVEALASAVDAKDSYTHGHSARVAKYAKEIAAMAGMSEEMCDDVYLAGLLHDVGKIGIADGIINKAGKLTDEEFAAIKQHPVLGDAILAKISMSPFLCIGARHHHERYDGKGYPDRLAGENIPQIARIIAVADAYDAMTSKRSYRDVIPQMQVREELIKGIGTQFDPEYARIMIDMLDMDAEYRMKENYCKDVLEADTSYHFGSYKGKVSPGLRITDCPVTLQLQYEPVTSGGIPTMLFYDSADARFYPEKTAMAEKMDFVEFGAVGLDGTVLSGYVRETKHNSIGSQSEQVSSGGKQKTKLQIVKQEDHLLVKILYENRTEEVTFALHDASRYLYLAFTGEQCSLDLLELSVEEHPAATGFIPRIVEKSTYIDEPEGDMPNVQIDAWRTARSEALDITEDLSIRFHSMSLPASRHVWHCPFLCLFTADDGKIDGQNYNEVALIRLDGEMWSDVNRVISTLQVSREENFENWNVWRDKNRAGVNCTLEITHEGNTVHVRAEDGGLVTLSHIKLNESMKKLYCYFTGDQCAITDIHVSHK